VRYGSALPSPAIAAAVLDGYTLVSHPANYHKDVALWSDAFASINGALAEPANTPLMAAAVTLGRGNQCLLT
jgi:hypothetical protein